MSLVTTRKKYLGVADDAPRNGKLPLAETVAAVAKAANFLCGRHNRVLVNQWIGNVSTYLTTNPLMIWRYNQIHNHGRQLRHEVVCRRVIADVAPGDTYRGNAASGEVTYSLIDADAVLATEETSKGHTWLTEAVVPSGAAANRQNGQFNGFRVVAVSVQERASSSGALNTANGNAVIPATFAAGEFIGDSSMAQLRLTLFEAWNRNRRQLVAWSAVGTSTTAPGLVTRSSLTYANMLDQTVTVWSASSPGLVLPLRYCARHPATTLPVRFAVYAQCVDTATGGAPAGTGEVRFDNGTSTVDIVGIAGAAGWFTAGATFPAKSGTVTVYDKVDVLVHTTNAADTIRIWAVSGWEEP